MDTCKAIIQEGSRKGERCKFPPNGLYCGRHLRNKVYDEGVEAGIKWCRFFFRGCNSHVIGNEVSCKDCKDKLCTKKNKCKHEGCLFKTNEEFCKKHERDKYKLEEIEKGIQYCDIDRGCFTIVKDKSTCEECLEKNRKKDNERYNKSKELLIAAKSSGSDVRTCIKCKKEFEAFNTRYNKECIKCKECSEKQKHQDSKRDRDRNYKEEHSRNLEGYYKVQIKDSLKRGYGDFQLNFDEFSEIVQKSCHYCNYIKENEVNGIDRVNNDLGYTKENCVPSCWKCNRMKHMYHPNFFIEKCHILLNKEIPINFYKKWSIYYTRTNYKNYKNYKDEAELSRKLPFEISQQQWDWLTRSSCYLCGYQDSHGIGIDRVDNNIRKYTLENCRPCCGSCNNMKNELSLSELLDQCKRVCDLWPRDSFEKTPLTQNPLKQAELKGHIMDVSERKHWKSEGLYYAILSNTGQPFLESNKDVYTAEEFTELCNTIIKSEKNAALSILKKLLVKLKKRKVRAV